MSTLADFTEGSSDPIQAPGWKVLPEEYQTKYHAMEAAASRGSLRQIERLPVGEVRYVLDDRTGRWHLEVFEP